MTTTGARVAVVGTGSVGRALARGLAADHEVRFGSRTPDDPSLRGVLDDVGATAATPSEATAWADVVLLAVPGPVAASVAGDLAATVAGKPLIDCTNRFDGDEESVAEAVAAAAPAAHVAKAFNTIGANRFTDPTFPDGTATMFVCGDDAGVAAASDLAAGLGFDVVAVGGLETARHLEALAALWVALAGTYGRDVGFRLLGVGDGG